MASRIRNPWWIETAIYLFKVFAASTSSSLKDYTHSHKCINPYVRGTERRLSPDSVTKGIYLYGTREHVVVTRGTFSLILGSVSPACWVRCYCKQVCRLCPLMVPICFLNQRSKIAWSLQGETHHCHGSLARLQLCSNSCLVWKSRLTCCTTWIKLL